MAPQERVARILDRLRDGVSRPVSMLEREEYAQEIERLSGNLAKCIEALIESRKQLTAIIDDGIHSDFKMWRDDIAAVLSKAEPHTIQGDE